MALTRKQWLLINYLEHTYLKIQWLWNYQRIWNQCSVDTTYIKRWIGWIKEACHCWFTITAANVPQSRWLAKWQVQSSSFVLTLLEYLWPYSLPWWSCTCLQGWASWIHAAWDVGAYPWLTLFGVEKCKRRAHDIMYWPGMSTQFEDIFPHVLFTTLIDTKEPMFPH